MARTKKRNKKFAGVDPAYLDKQRASLKRIHRKSVLFNEKELAAIDAYCKRFKVSSRSALIRQAVMERVLSGLEESHPKLF
ncbi:MAG: ribbon-helix-helix protein, CopG family [Bacteroidales bacterium]|nr:ribbon-helix-helix protein, CopG family [Bacteroidales bacterium]